MSSFNRETPSLAVALLRRIVEILNRNDDSENLIVASPNSIIAVLNSTVAALNRIVAPLSFNGALLKCIVAPLSRIIAIQSRIVAPLNCNDALQRRSFHPRNLSNHQSYATKAPIIGKSVRRSLRVRLGCLFRLTGLLETLAQLVGYGFQAGRSLGRRLDVGIDLHRLLHRLAADR
jgi:hypothetical protein